MTRKPKPEARRRRCKLGECEVGDIVSYNCAYLVMFGEVAGVGWVRWVDELTFKEISDPHFLPLDTDVEVVQPAAYRYANGRVL